MFVELVEVLRCPNDHEPSALVASAFVTDNRHIVEGELGCPVCKSVFPVQAGVVRLGDGPRGDREAPSAEDATRIAAFLELTDARGFALLCGRWGSHARPLRQLCDTPIVLVNPPVGHEADASGALVTPDRLPFAAGSARGAALDAGMPEPLVRSVVRSVRARGRVMGPASEPVPDGVNEIARDEHAWVGERTAAPDEAPRLVTLKRGGA